MRNKTILVIEDEPRIWQIQRAYLNRAGFDVAIAQDGQTGLQRYHELDPDLVILDLNLPKLDGVEVCKTIRESSDTPIIMVTARISIDDELTGLGMGADDYIKKPFDPKVLVARVKTKLRNLESDKLTFTRLVIDPDTMKVSNQDDSIRLTTKQFRILHKLASQPEKVFSREELLDALSTCASGEVYDRTVDVHIRNIRKAITEILPKDYKADQVVKTVSGKGYCFVWKY